MIDKLQISTSDFAITDEAIFRIWPASYKSNEEPSEGGILYECNGRYVYGAKAAMNNDKFNITIQPGFGMEVRFNPAVVVHQDNFHQVNESEFRQSLDTVSGLLNSNGIHLDMDSASITRLDIAQDRDMQEPIPAYHQVFRFLHAKRAKAHQHSTTYYFSNGNQQLEFYDKAEEMESRKMDISALAGRNIMRCEYKLRTKDAIKRAATLKKDAMNIQNIAALKKVSFGDLLEFCRRRIADFAFTVAPDSDLSAYSLKTEIEILSGFKNRYKRNALARYHEARMNLQLFGGIENYEYCLLAAGFDRTYIYRHIAKVMQSINSMEGIEGNGKKTIGALYQELYQAFVKAAA